MKLVPFEFAKQGSFVSKVIYYIQPIEEPPENVFLSGFIKVKL